MVSTDSELPIDSSLLYKSLRYLDQDRLPVRDEKYLRDFGINFIFDNPAVGVNKEKGQHLVELRDGTFIVDCFQPGLRCSSSCHWSLKGLQRHSRHKKHEEYLRPQ